MTTTWLKDTNGNKCSAEYFGSQRSRRTSTKGKLQMRIEYFDIKANHVACQGDVVLMPLPKGYSVDKSRLIKSVGGGTFEVSADKPTAQEVHDLLAYDPQTGIFRWRKSMGGYAQADAVAGSPNSDGYTLIKVNGVKFLASHLAWLYVHGAWPSQLIDHINRNRGDDRIANLREASRSENRHNARAPKNSTSGVKGVFWNAKRGKWQARICLSDGKRKHLGYFNDLEAAKTTYEAAAEKAHGEFAAHRSEGIVIAAGEVTGHHHVIGLIKPAYLHDGAIAHDLPVEAKTVDAVAALYEDGALVSRLVGDGVLTTPNLAIGFLTVEHGPVSLNHQEHDTIILPPGSYYVGRQREFNAGEERRVSD